MTNDRLANALVNGAGIGAVERRAQAAKQADKEKGLSRECSFCAAEFASAILSGPGCAICSDCAQVAQGFYLIKSTRPTITYEACLKEAFREYSIVEGRAPPMKAKRAAEQ